MAIDRKGALRLRRSLFSIFMTGAIGLAIATPKTAESASPTSATKSEGTAAPVPGNRLSDFCKAAPAPTVVRAKLHADSDLAHVVEVECVYGEATPTEHMAQRFFGTPEDETLLVSLEKDGNVVGTAWPVFKEKVSLEFGIPDMTEVEAVSLLQSPHCLDELKLLRDKGVRPVSSTVKASAPPGGGCAHCATAAPSEHRVLDGLSALALVAMTIVAMRRKRAS